VGVVGQLDEIAFDEADVFEATALGQCVGMGDVLGQEVDADKLAVGVVKRGEDEVYALTATGVEVAKAFGGGEVVVQHCGPTQAPRHCFCIKPVGVTAVGVITVFPVHGRCEEKKG
jgi:hypothetical protein